MNFKKIKTIFIVLFFLTNLFLIISIAGNSYDSTTISKDLIVQVCDILKNNGIQVDQSIIPSKKVNLPKLTTANNVELERKIASDLLSQKFEFKNIDGTDTYVFENNKLVLKNGNLIIFEVQQNSDLANLDEKSAQDYVKRIYE